MFTYSQTTGVLTHNGYAVSRGYSGHGEGVNNPAMQNVPMVGPCPQAEYVMQKAVTDPKLGQIAIRLVPKPGSEMFGRAGFFMHGDNANLDHTASEGCLIFDHDTRSGVAAAIAQGDNQLTVTE